jgi:flavin reductase (DIM6/NTAB) family NADH-FMN oxidoreductase RutF
MFYEPDKNDHGLPHNPYKSCVIPRPIGWITTKSRAGVVNLAPYSQFNNLGYDPPYVMFAANPRPDGSRKDSAANAVETGEFVCNMATRALHDQVDISSQMVDPEVDETVLAGLETLPSRLVAPPRIAASPVHLECLFHGSTVLPGYTAEGTAEIVIGRVIGVHIKDEVLTEDGLIDVVKINPIARLGYFDYTSVTEVFSLPPSGPHVEARRKGLGGEAVGRPKKQR